MDLKSSKWLEALLNLMGQCRLHYPRRVRKWWELDEVEWVASSLGDRQGGTKGRMSFL